MEIRISKDLSNFLKAKVSDNKFIDGIISEYDRHLYFYENMDKYEEVRRLKQSIYDIKDRLSYWNISVEDAAKLDNFELNDQIMNVTIDLIHYKGEADNILNKKYTLFDFFNGTRKEDKKRLDELGAGYDKGKKVGPIYSAEGIIGRYSDKLNELEILESVSNYYQRMKETEQKLESIQLKYEDINEFCSIQNEEGLEEKITTLLQQKDSFINFVNRINDEDEIIISKDDIHYILQIDGWCWEDYDGSGSLKSLDGKSYFAYDLAPYSSAGGIEYKADENSLWDVYWGTFDDYKIYSELSILRNYFNWNIEIIDELKHDIDIFEMIERKLVINGEEYDCKLVTEKYSVFGLDEKNIFVRDNYKKELLEKEDGYEVFNKILEDLRCNKIQAFYNQITTSDDFQEEADEDMEL